MESNVQYSTYISKERNVILLLFITVLTSVDSNDKIMYYSNVQMIQYLHSSNM